MVGPGGGSGWGGGGGLDPWAQSPVGFLRLVWQKSYYNDVMQIKNEVLKIYLFLKIS